jgi:hypothetical protein
MYEEKKHVKGVQLVAHAERLLINLPYKVYLR